VISFLRPILPSIDALKRAVAIYDFIGDVPSELKLLEDSLLNKPPSREIETQNLTL
jgi:hypothetical protein